MDQMDGPKDRLNQFKKCLGMKEGNMEAVVLCDGLELLTKPLLEYSNS